MWEIFLYYTMYSPTGDDVTTVVRHGEDGTSASGKKVEEKFGKSKYYAYICGTKIKKRKI